MIMMVWFCSIIAWMFSAFLWVHLGHLRLMERERVAAVHTDASYVMERFRSLEGSSCSAPMAEWDESFVDGLSE